MKRIFVILSFIALFSHSSQAQFWVEDFENDCESDCLADTYVGVNGAWTLTLVGSNGVDANLWYVSNAEDGNEAGECGSAVSDDESLHVGSGVLGDLGASYLNGGAGVFFPETDSRIESPVIDCALHSGLTLEFNYIEAGQLDIDDASLWYFDGVDWSLLDALAKTPTGTCDPQGEWTAFSVALPATADNNPNVKLGFRWVNNDDLMGTDPSFAVDDMSITALVTNNLPVALFEDPATPICAGDMLSFVDQSTTESLGGILNWSWIFGDFDTSSDQNPTDITFPDPGMVDVTLVVTDEFGNSIPYVFTVEVLDCTPQADFILESTEICMDQCISIVNNSISSDDIANIVYSWDFGNTNTSADADPEDQCYPDEGTVTVTLTITDSYGTDTSSQEITVSNCTPPTPAFEMSSDTICVGDCITLTDMSVGTNIVTWNWTFDGADTPDATGQDPGSICYSTEGNYSITLQVTDDIGTEDVSLPIVVQGLPTVSATTSAEMFCVGDSIVLNGSGAVSYSWDNGAEDGVYFIPPLGTTTYTVTGTAANQCTDTSAVTVTAIDCQDPVAAFEVSNQLICLGDCVDITDLSLNADTWTWNFGVGATPESFDGPNPPSVCFDEVGNYTLQLIISNFVGSDTATVDVMVLDIPTVIAFDEEVELGNEVVISASTDAIGGTYQWTPANLVNDPNSLVTTTSPTMDTNFVIEVTDENGCTNTDTAFVHVIIVPGVGVPTAFSPNEDGDNDDFGPLGEGYEIQEFVVYNRYGQEVFSTREKYEYWDGRYNGVKLNPGVFYWYFKYKWFVGEKAGMTEEMSGQVTLIK